MDKGKSGLSRLFNGVWAWLASRLNVGGNYGVLVLAVVLGVLTGLGAMLFRWLIGVFSNLFLVRLYDILVANFGVMGKYALPVIPALGGIIVGILIYKFAREAKGHGVPEVMESVALKGGRIRPRVALIKTIASALCIGTGGSAGREGPIVQIGSTLGSTAGQVLHAPPRRMRLLVGCGAAAGISATFNAPIAGAVFAAEIILGNFAATTFAPILISSVAASFVGRIFYGEIPSFIVPSYEMVSYWELFNYMVLGVLAGVVGVVFTRMLGYFEGLFEDIKCIPVWMKPAVGALVVGVIAIYLPQVMGVGYTTIEGILTDVKFSLMMMGLLVFAKILATSMTLGSGGSGGIFAPSLFIGAALGGFVGQVASNLFPGSTASPAAYALVGMAAVVSATTHAPLSALIILFEMTRNYKIILPLMFAVALATTISRLLYRESIYTMKLARRGVRIRGGREENILRSIKVSEVMRREYTTIQNSNRLGDVIEMVRGSEESVFPVLDREGEIVGIIDAHSLNEYVLEEAMYDIVVAEEVARRRFPLLNVDDNLLTALDRFQITGYEAIPVVDNGKVVGLLHRRDLFNRYQMEILLGVDEE
ncbi:MAG: chloride channel protein [Candidatus Coatesbacteria bacterium]|nr:MAG: chloride channel protein [Candidatus Coatesbacteria bacterium]